MVKPFKESTTVLVATACDFNKEEILSDNDPTCQKCRHGQINAMSKKKVILARSKQEQVQILTITPESLSIRRTYQQFEVSEHLVRKARKLWRTKPDAQRGHPIPQNEKNKVVEFYQLHGFT